MQVLRNLLEYALRTYVRKRPFEQVLRNHAQVWFVESVPIGRYYVTFGWVRTKASI